MHVTPAPPGSISDDSSGDAGNKFVAEQMLAKFK
jgi:hypothetical protein